MHNERITMKLEKHGRHWAVYADDGKLICVAVYKKGAQEVVRRLDNQRAGQHSRKKGNQPQEVQDESK